MRLVSPGRDRVEAATYRVGGGKGSEAWLRAAFSTTADLLFVLLAQEVRDLGNFFLELKPGLAG